MHRLRFEDTLLVVYELSLSTEKVPIDNVMSRRAGHVLNFAPFSWGLFCLSQIPRAKWTVALLPAATLPKLEH
jgi:hypothetical protein